MKTKIICSIGLAFFVMSYILFSQISLNTQKPIDFAHWFNLIGAVLLISFNFVFPKNTLSLIASIITTIGVVAHIGLCVIDFILWSFGNNEVKSEELRIQLSNTPSILYPFVIVGPSLLFVGLSLHATNFIKTEPIKVLMIIIGSIIIGVSFFAFKNGIFMLFGCLLFALGLTLLINKKN
ncbi:MAG: hypothetical protein E6Q46_05270 [Flavobacterium sp.]|nr:MAG: hypothetical protein E6Q46_05270 [Flavobacterium sp.]